MPLNRIWSTLHTVVPIPPYGVVGLEAGFTMPTSGWRALSEFIDDNRAILVDDENLLTGGSSALGSFVSDAGDSGHAVVSGAIIGRSGGTGGGAAADPTTAGIHGHSVSLTYVPSLLKMRFIVSLGYNAVPVGGVMFRTTDLVSAVDSASGLNSNSSVLSVSGGATVTASEIASGICTPASDSHVHQTGGGSTIIGSWKLGAVSASPVTAGTLHSHAFSTFSFSYAAKAALLKAFTRIRLNYGVQANSIIPFIGDTVPNDLGWYLCDGTNGTFNLIGYFIKLSATAPGTYSGADTVSGSCVLVPAGSHSHNIGTNTETHLGFDYSHNSYRSHGHNVTVPSQAYVAPYRTLKFIQYTGLRLRPSLMSTPIDFLMSETLDNLIGQQI